MSSLSSIEGNGFSTQDRQRIEELVNMDSEAFLNNYTGLESTRLLPVKMPAKTIAPIETDSDDSMEMKYLKRLRNPSPTPAPVVIQEQKPVVIQGPTRTRSLRPRQENQLRPYSTDLQRYQSTLRRANYEELLEDDPHYRGQYRRQNRRRTAEDRYEQEDGDESDEEEYEEPSLDPEDVTIQSLEKLTINRRRASAEKVKVATKPSRSTQSEGRTPPPTDIWTNIPRAPTVYASKKNKGRSAQEKGKWRAKPKEPSIAKEPRVSRGASATEEVLREVFDDLFSDNDDTKSQISLDSTLERAELDRQRELEQERQVASLEIEEDDEQVHFRRRRRLPRTDSLEDDTPLPEYNDPSVFDLPELPESSNAIDIVPSHTERPMGPPRRRKLPEDDGFIEHDGSTYDRPHRKKKRTTTRGVLPLNFIDPPKAINPTPVVEEMDCDDSPAQEDYPPLSPSNSPPSSPIDEQTSFYPAAPTRTSSSRPRQRKIGEFVSRSRSSGPTSHSSKPTNRRPAGQSSRNAQSSRSARPSNHSRRPKSSSASSSRNHQASTAVPRTSITPRKQKRADPNGKLYIIPGPDWTSFKRPHLTNGWAPTGEHRTGLTDQVRTTREWTAEIQQWVDEQSSRRDTMDRLSQQQIPIDLPPTSPIPSQDTGPTEPFARLLYKFPSLSIDYGIPDVERESHLRGTCYIMLGYLKQLLSPDDAAPSIGAFETSIELFDRNVTLTQDANHTVQTLKSLFREVFKRIASLFEQRSTSIPAAEKQLAITKLLPFFRFVTERLGNWALRLAGGQQRPTVSFLNDQCKLLYMRVWATAGMAIPFDNYSKTPPLLGTGETLGHAYKALLIVLIYALDWTFRFGNSEHRDDCKQRLLWILYWIGPNNAQLEKRDDGGLSAKEPIVAEAWICLLSHYAPNQGQCWQEVVQLLNQQAEQAGWTTLKKKQVMFHWLLVLNGLRHVDNDGVYSRPLAGISSVDGLGGHELAREVITAAAL